MFSNMGRKIRILAQVIAWVGISLSVLGGLVMIILSKDDVYMLFGIMIAVIGTIVSYISSFLLCGYGELIQANTDMLATIKEIKTDLHIVRIVNETMTQPVNQQPVNQPQIAVNPQITPQYAAQHEAQMKENILREAAMNNPLQQAINRTVYYVETAAASQPKPAAQREVRYSAPAPASMPQQPINVGTVKKIENKVVEISG